ncbi:hypothetical protein ACRJAL_003897 [Acinetobacter baumannii]|uniref:hypothetical protein n=1 Tax=Acinetobacter TaxID=469 RepID=UPI0028967D89|nr:hypothetical protein [Acinetobacter variabilis]
MYSVKAIKNILVNSLEVDKEFIRKGETFSKHNAKNEKVNIHLTVSQVQIFKDSLFVDSYQIVPSKDFKEAENQVRKILKFIKFHD